MIFQILMVLGVALGTGVALNESSNPASNSNYTNVSPAPVNNSMTSNSAFYDDNPAPLAGEKGFEINVTADDNNLTPRLTKLTNELTKEEKLLGFSDLKSLLAETRIESQIYGDENYENDAVNNLVFIENEEELNNISPNLLKVIQTRYEVKDVRPKSLSYEECKTRLDKLERDLDRLKITTDNMRNYFLFFTCDAILANRGLYELRNTTADGYGLISELTSKLTREEKLKGIKGLREDLLQSKAMMSDLEKRALDVQSRLLVEEHPEIAKIIRTQYELDTGTGSSSPSIFEQEVNRMERDIDSLDLDTLTMWGCFSLRECKEILIDRALSSLRNVNEFDMKYENGDFTINGILLPVKLAVYEKLSIHRDEQGFLRSKIEFVRGGEDEPSQYDDLDAGDMEASF